MLEKNILIKNETGIHARPAAILVKYAMRFESDINIYRSGNVYDAKSIMNVMSMGVRQGEEIHLVVKGPDEIQAFEEIVKLIENNFKEA
ncbi:HPr family phosphocarrier protein [Tindallia californiensis]|uniref:Phosphocarrier protein HPr n=1 Tax=Tindallia californiensis TaxID=159292 RepID=A0A1H3KJU9_9FIRM|nr:HPr family phosphocarrier protein [Tindallia californiensis]SDY51948.1 phosphocarrier protein [Tindallia californiensis]